MKYYEGSCYCCESATCVRHIDIYVIGSEGLVICHSCEMNLVEWLREQASAAAEKKKRAWLKIHKPEILEKILEREYKAQQ